jgi:hypothetical protein
MAGMTSQRAARTPRSWTLSVVLAAAWLGALACQKRAAPEPPAKLAPCTEVGQRCEFSPGKLGACVQRDDCQGKDCFICQSQH